MNSKRLLLSLVVLMTGSAIFAQSDEVNNSAEKFRRLLYNIEEMYVDSVNIEELTQIAIENMLEELDPHSVYYSAEELEESNEPLNGSFDGIGVRFNILKDTILVVSPLSGGPSEALGIRPGDQIIEIEGENVAGVGITNTDVTKKLKGPKGTQVNVGIKRGSQNELIPYSITRDKIPIYSIDATFMVDDKIGYIKVSRFARKTAQELKESLTKLKSQGMEELILDLQGNGGGYLRTAISMCDEFLSDDKLIVYTKGRAFPKQETNAFREGLFEKGKLIVLVDDGSASASEILSGAIQDWDRGVIIGRRSFGKGLVQRPVELPDGSAVRLTVQNYYTPSGRCIQKSYEDGSDAYRMEKYDRYMSGELFNQDSINFPDSLKYKTMIKGRTVYGGGGIMPDLFVGLDTSNSSDYFSNLIRNGVSSTFALEELNDNRDYYNKLYPDINTFIDKFEVNKKMMDELIARGEDKGVEFNAEEFAISKKALEIRLKALMARNLFDSSAFYQIINELNPSFRKSVEILKNGEFNKMDIAHRQYK